MTYLSKEDSIEFEGEKTVYHYTSIYTSLEHIFPSKKLRLSPVTSASDPMEYIVPNPFISSTGYEEDHERLNKNIDGWSVAKKINAYYKSIRQLCLCRNSNIDFEGQFTGVFEPIDHFGFAKPRMWDQYGDKYKGVCIALSRSKLVKQLSSEYRLIDVEYYKSQLFTPNIDSSSVDLNEIEKIGEQKYLESKCELKIEMLRTKHIDYKDENECKVITSTEDDFAYIDISECIQGIFFTNRLNYAYESFLIEIAREYNVPLLRVSIGRTGIDIDTFA